jgi:hypothetical protein
MDFAGEVSHPEHARCMQFKVVAPTAQTGADHDDVTGHEPCSAAHPAEERAARWESSGARAHAR